MSGPTIETLRRIARRHNSDRLVLFEFREDGTYKLVTYGRNPAKCDDAWRIGRMLDGWIQDGHLIR